MRARHLQAAALRSRRSPVRAVMLNRMALSTTSSAADVREGVVRTVQSSPYAQTHTSAQVINFGIGQPSPSLLPLELFQKAAQHRLRDGQDNGLFQYGAGQGYEGFRRDLAGYLSATQVNPIDPDALMITAGNSQAISHTAMAFTKHNKNKRVFVEEPTYFLTYDLFRELGLELSSVPVDAHGLNIDALEKRLEQGDVPAFLYTIPFFHNPTGTVLSPDRRARLIALAAKYDFRIISDEPYNLLTLDAKTPSLASLASYDTSGNVVSLGSFSKILSPGLRLGWAQSSRDTIRALAACGTIRSGGGQNPITASIVHSGFGGLVSLLYSPSSICEMNPHSHAFTDAIPLCVIPVLQLNLLAPHIAHIRQAFMSRKAMLCSALREFCPECAFVEPAGGYFVWIQLPRGVDAEHLLAEATARHGVAFTPGSRCSLLQSSSFSSPSSIHIRSATGACGDGDEDADEAASAMMSRSARLSFAFYSDDEIRLGVQRLSRAVRVIQSTSHT